MSTLVVLNPTAGRGKCARLRHRIEHGLRDAGMKYELVETTGPGHALGLARDAAGHGVTRLLCAGGDGTIHEAANGLLQAPLADDGATRVALGCIPAGTGDDFAKLVNVYRLPPEAAVARMARAEESRFDVGKVEGEYFDNVLGIGFDAEVVRHALKIRRLKGILVYLASIYRTFATFRAPVLEVMSAEHSETSAMMMLGVMNGVSEGGGFYLTPESDPADGFLDVCLIRKVGLLQFLRDVPRVMKGTHVDLEEVSIFRTQRLTIRCAERPLVLELDGELREPLNRQIEVTLEPRRLRVLVGAVSRVRAVALLVTLVTLVALAAAPARAQQPPAPAPGDTAVRREGPVPGVPARPDTAARAPAGPERGDSIRPRPPVSPGGAFLRSLAIPGWGQARLGRNVMGGLFLLFEGMAGAMVWKASWQLEWARTRDKFVASHRQEREDWITLLVFNHLMSGAEAYVSALLYDFPAALRVQRLPGGATGVGVSIPLR